MLCTQTNDDGQSGSGSVARAQVAFGLRPSPGSSQHPTRLTDHPFALGLARPPSTLTLPLRPHLSRAPSQLKPPSVTYTPFPPSPPPMPPQVISMRTIRRLYPSKENIAQILEANPGAQLGIITKIGAMAKTRTLTTIKPFIHKRTLRVSTALHALDPRYGYLEEAVTRSGCESVKVRRSRGGLDGTGGIAQAGKGGRATFPRAHHREGGRSSFRSVDELRRTQKNRGGPLM